MHAAQTSSVPETPAHNSHRCGSASRAASSALRRTLSNALVRKFDNYPPLPETRRYCNQPQPADVTEGALGMQSITIVRGDPPSKVDRCWSVDSVESLLGLPMNDLLRRAHEIHRAHHDPNAVQLSTLLSIKTGGCPE
ncbi:MAG: hypothetical protein M3Z74_07180, partial [Pseudomonadota bacterium]|nr:hypothetical protein [Pseudomonadota bacterium]